MFCKRKGLEILPSYLKILKTSWWHSNDNLLWCWNTATFIRLYKVFTYYLHTFTLYYILCILVTYFSYLHASNILTTSSILQLCDDFLTIFYYVYFFLLSSHICCFCCYFHWTTRNFGNKVLIFSSIGYCHTSSVFSNT